MQLGLLQNGQELHDVDGALTIRLVRLVQHLLQLVIGHRLFQLHRDSLQVLEVDEVLVLRKEDEGLLELLLGVTLAELGGHDALKAGVVDRDESLVVLLAVLVLLVVRQVLYQVLDLLFGGLEAESAQSHLQVLHVDNSAAIGVEEVESLADFRFLLVS